MDIDGAYFKPFINSTEKLGGYAVVARRYPSSLVAAVSGCSRNSVSPICHELEGANVAVKFSNDHGFQKVEFSCDSLQVITEVAKGPATGRRMAKNQEVQQTMEYHVNKILEGLTTIKQPKFIHMRRGANRVADDLAHYCQDKGYFILFGLEDFNKEDWPQIARFLDEDANGEKYPAKGQNNRWSRGPQGDQPRKYDAWEDVPKNKAAWKKETR